MSDTLNDQDKEVIQKAAEAIALHATGHSNVPTAEQLGIPSMFPSIMFPAPAISFIDGIKHLLTIHPRMLRACIIVESDSPLNDSPIHEENIKTGEILASFVIKQNGDEPRFVNFGLSLEDDLSNMAGLYTSITVMEEQLLGILSGEIDPDGSEATEGEDQ